MSGDNAGILRNSAKNLLNRVDNALNGTATGPVNKRKTAGEVNIAHVDHVGFGEVNDEVAIGVGVGGMNGFNFFLVEVNGKGMVKGNYREAFFFHRGNNPVAPLVFLH